MQKEQGQDIRSRSKLGGMLEEQKIVRAKELTPVQRLKRAIELSEFFMKIKKS